MSKKCSLRTLCDDQNCEECFLKSFASHEKAIFWSNSNETSPRDEFMSSHKKFTFVCDICHHEFISMLYSIKNDQWCPYCENKKLCDNETCLLCHKKSFASHSKAIFWSNSNETSPRDEFMSSAKQFAFACDVCKHEFILRLDSIKRGQWCQYCVNKKLCDNEKCLLCYEKSFASHLNAIFWCNNISSRNVFKLSNKKYLFDCDCGHSFESAPASISRGRWCPYCPNSSQKICNKKNCEICYVKSFASHPKSIYWSHKNDISAWQILKSSSQIKIFDCNVCGHEFSTSLDKVVNNQWCPYCSIPCKKLCKDNTCNFCFVKSFASNPKSQYWSNKNTIVPRDILLYSHKKYYFNCNTCNHTFKSKICYISKPGGTWCPMCINKTEKKVYDWLKNKYGNVEPQKKYNWCKNINELPYDFVLEDYKIIIELDGAQHFIQVSNWIDPNLTHKTDLFKMKCANKHGYSVIRILQDDVWQDKIDWEEKLETHIEYNKNPKNIFICNNNKYDNFMERTINKNLLLKKRILCGFDRLEHLENQ